MNKRTPTAHPFYSRDVSAELYIVMAPWWGKQLRKELGLCVAPKQQSPKKRGDVSPVIPQCNVMAQLRA